MDLQALVRPVVEQDGLELVEVFFGREAGDRVLRVTVDREGGLDLDTIAETSERIARRLDFEGFEPGAYRLEVSSPGLERPLKEPRDYARRIGQRAKVRVKLADGGGFDTFEGEILRAGERDVTIGTPGGERTVAYEDIGKARTVFEWGGTKRASTREKV